MKRSGMLPAALLFALIGLGCSNLPGSAADGVTVAPIRASWPIAREASGQWVVLGEVTLMKSTNGTSSIASITLTATDGRNEPAQNKYEAEQFRDMLILSLRNADGTYTTPEPAGSRDLVLNSLGFGLVALRTGSASQPTVASVTVTFTDGSSTSTDIALSAFDPGQEMTWPLSTTGSEWVAFNTTGGYYHWTAINGFPSAPGEFYISQRHAIDAFKIDADGNTSNPPASPNKEDYFAWGADILSAGSGTVVAVEKSKLDQNPGTEDTVNPIGNYVVIQHRRDLYSVYVHMMNNSAVVNIGDVVNAGQALGKIGNSGGTDQPHLHFQFVDDWKTGVDPWVSAIQSQGLPALFWNAKVSRLSSTALQSYLDPLPITWDDGINAGAGTYTMTGTMPLNMDFVTAP